MFGTTSIPRLVVKFMNRKLYKLIHAAKKITNKKHHLDFITAVLTIPVLLSVIILNYSNLQNLQKNKNNLSPTPTPAEKIIIVPQKTTIPVITSATACTKAIGPVEISTPMENQTVSDNPLCINIKYSDNSYCSVVWSYKINNGSWSEFTSNNPCIYNLPNGNVKFDLKIQSTVIQKEESLSRNFIYKGVNISPTATASASASQ